jgi:hypothetical protein
MSALETDTYFEPERIGTGWTMFVKREDARCVMSALRKEGYDVTEDDCADKYAINIARGLTIDAAEQLRVRKTISLALGWG